MNSGTQNIEEVCHNINFEQDSYMPKPPSSMKK